MRRLRAWAYIGLALGLLSLALFAPHAWATPDNQGTVPSPTRPKPVTPTSIVPTSQPRPAPAPAPTSTPQPGPAPQPGPSSEPGSAPNADQTPAAGQLPAVTASPAITQALQLALLVDPPIGWPGATMHFTATLSNQGREPIVSIAMTQTLSTGLVPGRLPVGSPARWEGQALHVLIPALAPGEQFLLPFSASVPRTAKLGGVLQTVGVAAGFGGAQAWQQTLVPLPPRELPRTGGLRAYGR